MRIDLSPIDGQPVRAICRCGARFTSMVTWRKHMVRCDGRNTTAPESKSEAAAGGQAGGIAPAA